MYNDFFYNRLNGLTGKQMRRMFFAQSPQAILVQSDPRHFVEYCCFKYLSKCSADFHPCIKVDSLLDFYLFGLYIDGDMLNFYSVKHVYVCSWVLGWGSC